MSSVPSTDQTLSGPESNAVLLESGQHHPERMRIEKAKLMGRSRSPHLHLDLTGRVHALFKVTTDATFVPFSKYSLSGHILIFKLQHNSVIS